MRNLVGDQGIAWGRFGHTHLSVMVQQTPAVWANPEAIRKHDGLRDQFLWQSQENSGCLQQLGRAETNGRLKLGGDAIKL